MNAKVTIRLGWALSLFLLAYNGYPLQGKQVTANEILTSRLPSIITKIKVEAVTPNEKTLFLKVDGAKELFDRNAVTLVDRWRTLNFSYGLGPDCMIFPAYRISFYRNDGALFARAVICFKCSQIMFLDSEVLKGVKGAEADFIGNSKSLALRGYLSRLFPGHDVVVKIL